MEKIEINKEIKEILTPLSDEEYTDLQKSLLLEGCRDALVVWNKPINQKKDEYKKILLDGHNRYEICKKHNIPFETVEKGFDGFNDVKIWVINNQFSRRNLSKYERCVLALKKKEIIAKQAKEKQLSTLKKGNKTPVLQKSVKREIDTQKELAKQAKVSHDTIHKVDVIEKEAPKEVKEKIKKGEITINKAYQKIQIQNKQEKIKKNHKTIKMPDDTYSVIYADPPWRYNFSKTKNREIENQYPTMTLDEIKNIPLPKTTDDAVLYLWATAPKLIEALEIMKTWGFTYKTHAIWDKQQIGMGYWFRGQHELLLVGTKGNFSPPDEKKRTPSIFKYKRGKHSKKPDDIRKSIEKWYPKHKKIELFAREKPKNWDIWGTKNEN